MSIRVGRNRAAEWPLGRAEGEDPAALVDLLVATPSGRGLRVPAFATADGTLRVRYSSGEVGVHTWRVEGPGSFPREAGEIEVADLPERNALIEPHPEWVEPRWSEDNYMLPYAGGIPGELRLIYLMNVTQPVTVRGLEPGARYRACHVDPSSCVEHDLGIAEGDAEGNWMIPQIEVRRDWLVVLERE